MLQDECFTSRGEMFNTSHAHPVTEDGSHPSEWKGNFVIVKNDMEFAKGELVQYHRCAFRSSVRNRIGYFTYDYRESFNPTVFRTLDDAMNALSTYVKYEAAVWQQIEAPADGNLLGMTQTVWKNKGIRTISPLFEILDACDYRIERRDAILGRTDRIGIKSGTGNPGKRPTPSDEVRKFDAEKWIRENRSRTLDEILGKTRKAPAENTKDTWKASMTTTVKFASKVSPERKAKAKTDSKLKFIAQDSKSGLFLSIPTGGSFRDATLAKLDDATYFPTLDSMLGVLNAIERSFWIPDFQRWHLVGRTALIENDRVVHMQNL